MSAELSRAKVMAGSRPRVLRVVAVLPWLLLGLTVILAGIAVLFFQVNQTGPAREPLPALYGDMLYLFDAVVVAGVGALIAARRRHNLIGWLLLVTSLIQVAEDVFTGYSAYTLITQPGALPAGVVAAWFAQWMWTPPFAALLLGILLYPTGQLLSPRWRIVAGAGLVGVTVLLVSTALSSELFVGSASSPVLLHNPIGLIDAEKFVQPIIIPLSFAFLLAMLFAGLVSLILRFRRARGDERQQLKWFTYAIALALVTEVLASALLGEWAQIAQNLSFLMLPLAIGIAILRYRLYEIDLLINRTLVYVPLTALLAGIFSASITLTQKVFVAITGATSDAATVLTTLLVVAAFEPLKTALQSFVDRRFKEAPDPTRKLNALGDQMRAVLQVIDVEQMTRRVLDEAVGAFGARGGAIYLDVNGKTAPVHTIGDWNGDAQVRVPLQDAERGTRLGVFELGARKNGAEYSEQDRAALERIASLMARAIVVEGRANGGLQ